MMKYIFISFLCLAGFSSALAQSDIKEAYFHELKGMEDSSGVTHLFYNMYDLYEDTYSCGDRIISYYRTDDNIFHFDTSTDLDSLLFEQYSTEYCGGYYYYSIFDYTFLDQDPNKWIIGKISNSKYRIQDFDGHLIEFYLPVPTKGVKYRSLNEFFPKGFFLTSSQDSLFIQTEYSVGSLIFPGNGEGWPQFSDHIDYLSYTDSVNIDWNVIAQHPDYDSVFFSFSNDTLFKSEDYGSTWNKVFQGYNWYSIGRLQFHTDSSNVYVYAVDDSELIVSDSYGEANSWSQIPIESKTNSQRFLTVDGITPGLIYYSDSASVFVSDDYGESFSLLYTTEQEITGLYKKPDSDILYVLTTEELLEVNVETQATTSLKKIPVSNEPEPSDVPNQITLEQNYPNPFNPSTVISYQLSGNSLVRMEVFDVTGRKVAVLVNGVPKTAGTHRVTFDASGLSSGVYFYRLEADGQTLTKKMMLMK